MRGELIYMERESEINSILIERDYILNYCIDDNEL